jgi:RiboL-PSP-HEPN
MWIPLRTEILDRFTAVESYFKATYALGGAIRQDAKGIAFVQIYAVYEYTARAVVRTAIDSIATYGHRTQDLIPSLISLFLDSELTGLKDCPRSGEWERRIGLFEQLFAPTSSVPVRNTAFPNDGSHFRHEQLQTIFDVLGIKRTPAQRRRHLRRIDEVVGHRNAIAHGGEPAGLIGSRYTRADILLITRQIRSVCLLLISAIERQCSDPARHCRAP